VNDPKIEIWFDANTNPHSLGVFERALRQHGIIVRRLVNWPSKRSMSFFLNFWSFLQRILYGSYRKEFPSATSHPFEVENFKITNYATNDGELLVLVFGNASLINKVNLANVNFLTIASQSGCALLDRELGLYEQSINSKTLVLDFKKADSSPEILDKVTLAIIPENVATNHNQWIEHGALLFIDWLRNRNQIVISSEHGERPSSRFHAPHYVKLFWGYSLAFLYRKLERLFFEEYWMLLLQLDPKKPLFKGTRLMPGKDRDWADPFLIQVDEFFYVFFEEKLLSETAGFISFKKFDANGVEIHSDVVLKEPFHLSFPFLIQHDGNFFMVPESAASGKVTLYKSKNFPYQWEPIETWMEDVHAYDNTIHFDGSRYWLFQTRRRGNSASPDVELFLFFSDTLLGANWKPHRQNPIIRDVSRARPAGALFFKDNKLVRPAQCGTPKYGYSIKFMEVIELSEQNYIEVEWWELKPQRNLGIRRVHSFNQLKGGEMVADYIGIRSRFSNDK
jgi:hypothetical protein